MLGLLRIAAMTLEDVRVMFRYAFSGDIRNKQLRCSFILIAEVGECSFNKFGDLILADDRNGSCEASFHINECDKMALTIQVNVGHRAARIGGDSLPSLIAVIRTMVFSTRRVGGNARTASELMWDIFGN